VRLKSPLSGHEASRRWGLAREVDLIRKGKDGVANGVKVEAPNESTPALAEKKLGAPKDTKKVATLAEFGPRFIREFATANGQHQAGIDAKESILRLHLTPNLGEKRLEEITTADVQRLKAIYREGVRAKTGGWKVNPTNQAKTINNRLTVLNKLLKVACEWGEIPAMPCTIRLLKITDSEAAFYEQEILDRIYEAAAKVDSDAYVMALLGGGAGLRRGEMLGLNQADIDFKRCQLHVQRHIYKGKEGPPKNGKSRHVPMTQALMKALLAHRHLRGERDRGRKRRARAATPGFEEAVEVLDIVGRAAELRGEPAGDGGRTREPRSEVFGVEEADLSPDMLGILLRSPARLARDASG
jgi:integrase